VPSVPQCRHSAAPVLRKRLQILRREARVLCGAGKHSLTDFLTVVKSKNDVGPPFA
jgi:hypothetical protein